MYQPERLIDLWGAVARTAIKNRRTGYASAKHRDAARFLEAAGLLVDGRLRYDDGAETLTNIDAGRVKRRPL